jgi:hypothetical protein
MTIQTLLLFMGIAAVAFFVVLLLGVFLGPVTDKEFEEYVDD